MIYAKDFKTVHECLIIARISPLIGAFLFLWFTKLS
ncbi:hypothetical protein VPHF86_0291 [Vibrio phage F86]